MTAYQIRVESLKGRRDLSRLIISGLAPAVSGAVLDEDDERGHDIEDPDHGGPVAEAKVLKGISVYLERQEEGGVMGAAFGHKQGGGEVILQADDSVAEEEQQESGCDDGQGEVTEPAPGTRAVHQSGVYQFGRDVSQSGQ